MSQLPSIPAPLRDRFQPLAALGQGTAGQVFRALDRELDREVVVKILRPGAWSPTGMAARFRREAKTLAGLDHPRVLRLLAYGVIGSQVYTVHPFVPGQDLRRLMQGQDLDVPRAVHLLTDAFDGLAYVHDRGVLHRDLKPENLYVGEDGRLLLIDFGLAKGDDDETLTKTDTLVGTPVYMAPELLTEAHWSAAGDVYSLGVIAYELLARRNPFHAGDLAQTVRRHAELVPPPPTGGRHPELDALVMCLIEKLPEERPTAASALASLRSLDAAAPAGAPHQTETLAVTVPPPESPAPPAAAPWSRSLVALLAFLALTGAAALLGPSPEPAATPPPSTPAAGPAPPTEPRLSGSLEALPALTSEALDQLFDRRGRDPDWGDPARWAEREGSLPGPDTLRSWAADGGRLTALPRAFRRALASVDADALGLGAQPIFGPLATAVPGPPRLGAEAALLEHEPHETWLADPDSSWRGAALTALGEAVSAANHAHRILARPDVPGTSLPDELRGYLPEATMARMLSRSRTLAFERVSAGGPAARRALASWLRKGVAATWEFWFCAARSLRVEGPDVGFAHQVGRWTHALTPLFFSHLAHAPLEDLLGLDPTRPTEAIVALEIIVRQARVRRAMGPLEPAFTARFREIWRRAMAVARRGPEGSAGIGLALQRLVQTPVDLASLEEWSDLFDFALEELRDLPAGHRASYAGMLERFIEARDDRSEFPEVRAGLAALRRP